MKTCETCIFWKRYTEESDIRYHGEHKGGCSCGHFVYTGDGTQCPIDGVGFWDYESYDASFETGRDFGCIHWVDK